MESDCNEKITLKFTPCKPPTPCSDYDDYDPCESSDAIDEKDLAILLKEEKAKLQEARQNAQFEEEREKALLQGERGTTEDERLKNEYERFGGTKKCRGKKDGATEEEKAPKKKCAKVIKNPFFGNRLEFSSGLPPPPPNPPAQFFPSAEEEECKPKFPCPKRKSGKPKCKKTKTDEDDKNKNEMEHADDDELNRGKGEIECTCEEDEFGMGTSTLGEGGQGQEGADDSRDKWKRKCQKALNRAPCRKRDSDICNPFQPREIPARQRELPARSPLELPEVERQVWLSSDIDCPMECARNNCQMSCSKRKCKKKRQNSLDESNN